MNEFGIHFLLRNYVLECKRSTLTNHPIDDRPHCKPKSINMAADPSAELHHQHQHHQHGSAKDEPDHASVQMLNPFVHTLELVTSADKIKVMCARNDNLPKK